ncbi:MAG: acetylglutamate kinase [Oscillospiraceae bacterium]|jgi:acetylglutamate kinase|nr:acetylglutamate kinase [Oscillospiraceae bacterium]
MSHHEEQLFSRAEILSEALPYIRKFSKKTVVVKYGGNAMLNEEIRRAVISDIVLLSLVGIRVVVVHGGGPEINQTLAAMGKQSKFVNGLRYTDRDTMDVVQMVLAGKVGKDLCGMITLMGGKAVGLCGLDGAMITAVRKKDGADYGLVGEIAAVDPHLCNMALDSGYIPVVSTVAQGDDEDTAYNINADTAAAELAVSLNAEKLILLTDIRGLCRDPKDESTLIRVCELSEIPGLIKEGVVTGGMIPKIDSCITAIRKGVKRVHILDGRIPHAILVEMLTNTGIGTMITA